MTAAWAGSACRRAVPRKPRGAIKFAWYRNGENLVLLPLGWGAPSLGVTWPCSSPAPLHLTSTGELRPRLQQPSTGVKTCPLKPCQQQLLHRPLCLRNGPGSHRAPVRVDKLPALQARACLSALCSGALCVELTAPFSQLLQNAQESHGVAVPTPSVPEDFEEKAALGKESSLLSPGRCEVLGSTVPSGREACVY